MPAGIDAAAGAVDVHVDGLIGVFAVEIEQLRHNQIGNLVVNGRAKKDNAFLQKQTIDIIGPLATASCR